MEWFFSLREALRRLTTRRTPRRQLSDDGCSPLSRDTQAAIGELTRLAESRSDSVEIYLALGNLFRSQGEIERAVNLRRALIERYDPDSGSGRKPSTSTDKALLHHAWYELGRDYHRGGFLDRARQALETARDLAGDDPVILAELARLALDSADMPQAARWYKALGHAPAQAHCLVREAQEHYAHGAQDEGNRLLARALRIHAGSVEAHLLTLRRTLEDHPERLAPALLLALSRVEPGLRFVILDDLLAETSAVTRAVAGSVASVLAGLTADVLVLYYGGLFLLAAGERAEACSCFEKSLVMDPGFWPARLEMLGLASSERDLSPVLHEQLAFFVAKARELKKFACRACGLRQRQVFFVCPRCQSWHSIAFRMSLND